MKLRSRHRRRPPESGPRGQPLSDPPGIEPAPATGAAVAADYEWLTAFDELAEPVFVHDKEYRILRCNPAYAAFAAQPMEAILGKPYWQVFPKLSGPLANCVEALTKGASTEKSELTAAGGQVFLSYDITAHRASGEFWYSRHLMENMTARRRDEDTDKLRAALADAIVRNLPGILLVVDRNKRLAGCNAGLVAAMRRPEEHLLGTDALSFIDERDRQTATAHIEEAFAKGRAEGEIRLATEDAESCFFSARRFEASGAEYVACAGVNRAMAGRMESHLASEKALSDIIVESAPGPYYVIDPQMNLVRWNAHLRETSGLGDKELLGSSILKQIHEDDRSLASAKFLAAFATGSVQMEVRVPTTYGIRLFLKTARRFEIGGASFVSGFCVDVTERKLAERALAEQQAFSEALVNSVPGAFYVLDREGNYHTWNSYLNRITGFSDEELQNRCHLLTIEEKDRPLAADAIRQAFEEGYAQVEVHVLTRDRGARLYFMTARRFEVGDQVYLVGVGMDTTDRGARMRALEEEARTDALTQVANRTRFLSLAAQEFARSRRFEHPLSLWMIDIDHFKSVNDTYGHHAGDVALQAISALSRQTLRDWDIMGRMGGEEFAVLLPETDTSQSVLVAERLRQKVATASIEVDGGTMVHLTVSIGVAAMRLDDLDVDWLMERADQALLEAKRTGRDKVCVAPPPDEERA